MFCKNCGTKNPEGALYCSHDGVALTQVSDKVQLYRENVKFCQNCSHENGLEGLYCVSCGHSFEKGADKVEEKIAVATKPSQFGETTQSSNGFIASLLDKQNLIHSAIFIGISIVALFIISMIVSSSINNFLRDSLRSEMGPFVDAIKLVSMTDVFMLSHLTSVNYTASAMFMEVVLKTTSGLFLLLVVPALIFIIVGFLMHRKYTESPMVERLTRCLSFSVVYGLLIGIISLFSGISMSVEDPSGFIGEINISADYSFLESIFNGFIISFIFTSIGSLFGLSKKQRVYNQKYGVSISRAILNSMIGLFVMIGIGIVLVQSSEEIALDNGAGETLVGSQLGGYLWNIAQFGTLKFDLEVAEYQDDNVSASYSILGGAKASEDEEEFKELFEEFNGTIWLLLLIPIGLHFWAGTQLRKATQGNLLYELGVYAIAFGIVNAVIVSISKLSVDTNFDDAFVATFGFSTIAAFFLSAIFAFVVSYGAVMLTNRQASGSYGQTHSA